METQVFEGNGLAPQVGAQRDDVALEHRHRRRGRPRWARAESPRPMPTVTRSPASTARLSAAAAVAAGWRVTGLVTDVASLSRDVAAAAAVRATQASPARFCESVTPMPAHPAASMRADRRAIERGADVARVHSSTVPPGVVDSTAT